MEADTCSLGSQWSTGVTRGPAHQGCAGDGRGSAGPMRCGWVEASWPRTRPLSSSATVGLVFIGPTAAASSLHFHDHQARVIHGHDVDLALVAAPVAVQDLHPGLLEITRGKPLAVSSNAVGSTSLDHDIRPLHRVLLERYRWSQNASLVGWPGPPSTWSTSWL